MKDNGTLHPEETYTATELLRAVLRETQNDAQRAFDALHGRLRAHGCARSASRILSRATRQRGVTHVDYVGRGSFRARRPQMHIVGVNSGYQPLFEYAIDGTMTDEQLAAEYVMQAQRNSALKLIQLVNGQGRTVTIHPPTRGTAPSVATLATKTAEAAAR